MRLTECDRCEVGWLVRDGWFLGVMVCMSLLVLCLSLSEFRILLWCAHGWIFLYGDCMAPSLFTCLSKLVSLFLLDYAVELAHFFLLIGLRMVVFRANASFLLEHRLRLDLDVLCWKFDPFASLWCWCATVRKMWLCVVTGPLNWVVVICELTRESILIALMDVYINLSLFVVLSFSL